MRRLASLLLLLAGCAPPLGAPPSIEPHLPARAQTSSCEPAGATLWDEAILRLPALLEHEQVDRAAERFEILRSWFPARGRATVWLQAEGGVACHPVDLGLTLERVRGRRKTDVTEGDGRLQTMISVVLEPWGISAWFQSRDGVREGDDWRWAPYEHAVLPMHTAKYLSAIDDRVAVYGGTTYRLTTTCVRRETRDQACTQGRSRRCPVCVEIGLRRIDATRARGIPLELPSTVIREDDVDCSQRCPGEPDASRRAELNAVLATRVFYRDAGDGPRVYRDEEACQAEAGERDAETAPWHAFP